MEKPLILCDVDGTLIGKDYQMTDPQIQEVAQKLQIEGFKIGLNSDTPFVRLQPLARELGLNGPIVTELGNAIFDSADSQFPRWEDKTSLDVFSGQQMQLLNVLCDPTVDYNVIIGNSRELREQLLTAPQTFSGRWLIIDSKRKYSMNFYTLSFHNGAVTFDLDLLQSTAEIVKKLLLSLLHGAAPLIDVNTDYGICIAHEPKASKRKAGMQVFSELGVKKIVMIGDSWSDFLNDPRVTQMAVGNASIAYKSACSFAAGQPLTTGVIECLEHVLQIF